MVKVKEDGIVDPMAKFKNNQDTLKYANSLEMINQKKNKAIEIKDMKAEEVKME